MAIWAWNPRPPGPLVGCQPVTFATTIRVTRAAVSSTTNMTGFLMRCRGSSLRTAFGMAERSRSGSMTPRGRGGWADGLPPRRVTKRWNRRVPRPRSMDRRGVMTLMSEELPCILEQLLHDRPQREGREERQGADDDDHADQEDAPQHARGRERAEGRRHPSLGRHRACQRQDRDDHPVATDQHRQRAGDVVEGRVARETGNN